MKKIKSSFLVVLSFFLFTTITRAATNCEYSELAEINQQAANVKVTYEEKLEELEYDEELADLEEDETPETYYKPYLMVNITNITENLYVKVTNSSNNSTKIFSSEDAVDGIVSFRWDDIETVTNLTVKVYTSKNTNCSNKEIITQQTTLPMYNPHSDTAYCEEYPDDRVCQEYVTTEISEEEFEAKANKAYEKRLKEINENSGVGSSIKNFFTKNKKGIIIGGSIVIALGVVTTLVIIVKRRRSRII